MLARFTGTGRRFELHQLGDLVVVDDYGHHPTEIVRTIAAARERFPAANATRPLPTAPLLPHAAPRLGARRGAQRSRRRDGDRHLRRARAARARRHGQARRRRVERPRPPRRLDAVGGVGRRAAQTPARARRRCPPARRRRHRPRRRLARSRVKELVPLARYTTIGTGGPARWFAEPETVPELVSALAWAGRPASRRRGDRARLQPARARRRRRRARAQAGGRARSSADRGRCARRGRRSARTPSASTAAAQPAWAASSSPRRFPAPQAAVCG